MYCDLSPAKFVNNSARTNSDTINVVKSDNAYFFENHCERIL